MDIFTGDYDFFDYKGNIEWYNGQDYGGFAQYLYLMISAVLLTVLLVSLRKTSRERVRRIIGYLGIFLVVFYLGKTAWESYYDIRQAGGFNKYLLPFDTCSLIMPAAVLTGFGNGRVQRMAKCWIATGGVVGGFATMLFLNAFKYYPFLSFGATYSMVWHFLMVFMGLLVLVSERPPVRFPLVVLGYLFHLIASAIVIPIDFIFGFDFMMYRDLGGVPFFEGIAGRMTDAGVGFLNPALMLVLYFAAFCIVFVLAAGIKNRRRRAAPSPAANE